MVGWLFCWNCLSELPKPKKLAVKLLAPFGWKIHLFIFCQAWGKTLAGRMPFLLKSCKSSSQTNASIAKVLWYHSVPFWPVPSHLYKNIITVFGQRYIEPKRCIFPERDECYLHPTILYVPLAVPRCRWGWGWWFGSEQWAHCDVAERRNTLELGLKKHIGEKLGEMFQDMMHPRQTPTFSAQALRHQWSSDQHTVVVGDFDQHHLRL